MEFSCFVELFSLESNKSSFILGLLNLPSDFISFSILPVTKRLINNKSQKEKKIEHRNSIRMNNQAEKAGDSVS